MTERGGRRVPWYEVDPSNYGVNVSPAEIAPFVLKIVPQNVIEQYGVNTEEPEFIDFSTVIDLRRFPTWLLKKDFEDENTFSVIGKGQSEYVGKVHINHGNSPVLRYELVQRSNLKRVLAFEQFPLPLPYTIKTLRNPGQNVVVWQIREPQESSRTIIAIQYDAENGWGYSSSSLVDPQYVVSGNGERGGIIRDLNVFGTENIPLQRRIKKLSNND